MSVYKKKIQVTSGIFHGIPWPTRKHCITTLSHAEVFRKLVEILGRARRSQRKLRKRFKPAFEELKRFMKLLKNFGNSSKVFSRCFYDFLKFSENLRKSSEVLGNLWKRFPDVIGISKKWCRLGGLGQRVRPFGESLSRPQIMFVVGIIYSQVYLPKTIHKTSVKRKYK